MEYTSLLEERVEALEKERDDLLEQLKKMETFRKEEKSILMEALEKRDKDIKHLQETLQDSEETIQKIQKEFAIYKMKVEENALEEKNNAANLSQLSISEKSFIKGETKFRGNVCISACEPTGKYVILENTSGSEDEDLSGFRIDSTIDGQLTASFELPVTVLRAGKSIKVFSKNGGGRHVPPTSIVASEVASWGEGDCVEVTLVNIDGFIVARHEQTKSFK